MSALAIYFAHAAINGPYGVLVRVQVLHEIEAAKVERADLQARVDRLKNLTKRLSNDYLDLDLLDERARHVLGLIRPDEVVIDKRVTPNAGDRMQPLNRTANVPGKAG
ncbi:septum formation initiator family protein [Paracoccus sp. R12_1]|nr:septum formation initiator family protein [Paracoccus sp. R12_2]MBO9488738.1 septum formation initiator family protein [Paracoccus sp. R12_1]